MNQVKSYLHCSDPISRAVLRCFGCGKDITDKHVLLVQPDLYWHGACLKCIECCRILDETCTCYVRHNKTYCKFDYHRLFKPRCAKCNESLDKADLVMKHNSLMYHTDCFQCSFCYQTLMPGDEFRFENDNLFCKLHCNQACSNNLTYHHLPSTDNKESILKLMTEGKANNKSDEFRSNKVNKTVSQRKDKSTKSTRIRTVLNEKQLQMLRACYSANPRPDALLKEQLVEMTGLSPRVIRVWFQNKRCKDKKRQIAIKLFQQETERVCSFNGLNEFSTNNGDPSKGFITSSYNADESLKHLHGAQRANWVSSVQSHYHQPTSRLFNAVLSSVDTVDSGSCSRNLIFTQELNNEFSTCNYSPSCLTFKQSSCDDEFYSSSPRLAGSDMSSSSCSE